MAQIIELVNVEKGFQRRYQSLIFLLCCTDILISKVINTEGESESESKLN